MKKIIDHQNTIMLSICTITYKQADFIKETIDGVLMQKVNFPIEFIIADDCSPDNTKEIVDGYIENHPRGNIIQFTSFKKNKGIRDNFTWALKECKGKYIAVCEGDDYWTDPLKLQKQVDFLEENSNYSGCAHNAIVLDSGKVKFFDKKSETRDIFFKDCMETRKFHTASLVFKSELIKTVNFPAKIVSLDRALFLLITFNNPVRYFGEVMCCYRKNEGGISRRVTATQMQQDLNIVKWIKGNFYRGDLSKLTAFIHKTVLTYSTQISLMQVFRHYFMFVFHSLLDSPKNLKNVLSFTKNYGIVLLKKTKY